MTDQVMTGRFVGRTQELARLGDLLALVAVVAGEAGSARPGWPTSRATTTGGSDQRSEHAQDHGSGEGRPTSEGDLGERARPDPRTLASQWDQGVELQQEAHRQVDGLKASMAHTPVVESGSAVRRRRWASCIMDP